MYCIHCGKQISDKVIFCPYCGTKQEWREKKLENRPAQTENHELKRMVFDLKSFKYNKERLAVVNRWLANSSIVIQNIRYYTSVLPGLAKFDTVVNRVEIVYYVTNTPMRYQIGFVIAYKMLGPDYSGMEESLRIWMKKNPDKRVINKQMFSHQVFVNNTPSSTGTLFFCYGVLKDNVSSEVVEIFTRSAKNISTIWKIVLIVFSIFILCMIISSFLLF